jgi:DNA primase
MALDADASGHEAMLRAARAARERGMELRVVALPEGSDPADLVAADGPEAFERLLDDALSVPEFEAERVLAAGDLSSARGRDRALERLRPLVAETPERSVVRDELVRRLADRLEVPPSYLAPAGAAGPPSGRSPSTPNGRTRGSLDAARGPAPDGSPGARPARAGAAATPAERGEQAFLAMCLSQPRLGRELLERAGEEHLSERMRPVGRHLREHLDDPLGELPGDEEVAALVTETAMLAEAEPSTEPVLRLTFLQLDLRRVERELRRAATEHDFDRHGVLVRERERVRQELDDLMGEAD